MLEIETDRNSADFVMSTHQYIHFVPFSEYQVASILTHSGRADQLPAFDEAYDLTKSMPVADAEVREIQCLNNMLRITFA